MSGISDASSVVRQIWRLMVELLEELVVKEPFIVVGSLALLIGLPVIISHTMNEPAIPAVLGLVSGIVLAIGLTAVSRWCQQRPRQSFVVSLFARYGHSVALWAMVTYAALRSMEPWLLKVAMLVALSRTAYDLWRDRGHARSTQS